ncbi:hypothetical protein DFH29DRAFT_260491 [Suillus ampliporus]|nr:hypothetical protein DFH29DRAFT_260491 [Suillus ampliporus]
MPAQAQGCIWQRARSGNVFPQPLYSLTSGLNHKNSLMAKLATKVLYPIPYVRFAWPPRSVVMLCRLSIPHLETKNYHFSAASQYRNMYGDDIQRLIIAETDTKKAFDIAKCAGVAEES